MNFAPDHDPRQPGPPSTVAGFALNAEPETIAGFAAQTDRAEAAARAVLALLEREFPECGFAVAIISGNGCASFHGAPPPLVEAYRQAADSDARRLATIALIGADRGMGDSLCQMARDLYQRAANGSKHEGVSVDAGLVPVGDKPV